MTLTCEKVIEKDNNILMVDKIFYILKKNLLKTF